MIDLQVSLQPYNTFGIDVAAAEFAVVRSVAELKGALAQGSRAPFILGGGSNMLLTGDLDRLVIRNAIPGINVIDDSESDVLIKVGGGVNWHQLVLWAVERGFGGIENLALIPGNAGAAPIQNIGAYGCELVQTFDHLEAVNLQSGELESFDQAACQFDYRDSLFKGERKGQFCITQIFLRLNKRPHQINDSYGAISSTLLGKEIHAPTIKDVCEAVVSIRSSKLPDPAVLGNSGSFFKNPVIPKHQWAALLAQHPELVYYPNGDQYKIPAGWLIEQAGWKGKRVGNVGCYEKQALVIVNYGGASGQEVYDHALRVQASVEEQFGIVLTPEVNVL